MKFTVLREALLKPLTLVAGAVEKRHTLPILSHILITLENQKCTLTGTDLEVELTGSLTLEQTAQDGSMTVPARKLLDICRALPEGGNIEFIHENQRLTIKSGRTKFNLATLPAAEFPHVETTLPEQEICINSIEFQTLFKQTHFAMASQDVRYFLNGALLEMGGDGMKVIATDGHRLAISQTLQTNSLLSATQAIIPRKGVMEMLRLFQAEDETLSVYFGHHFLKITSGEATFITKLIDGRYPDYRKVIPRPSEKFLLVEKTLFQQALGCIAIVTTDKYRGVRVQIRPNLLRLLTRNPEQEEAEQEISLHEQTADELDIGFNVTYLQDALNAIESEQIKLTFSDADSGVVLESAEGKGGRYVVMPMRL